MGSSFTPNVRGGKGGKEDMKKKKHIFKVPTKGFFLETLTINGQKIYEKIVKRKLKEGK